MKSLVIIGAGGLGREAYNWAQDILESQRDWEIAGFLDDNLSALENYSLPHSVVDTIEGHEVSDKNLYVLAIADVRVKLKLASRFLEQGAQFTNVVHPTAIVSPYASLGIGNIICPYAIISSHAALGNFILVNMHTTIGHDATISDGCTLFCQCDVTGNTHLGRGVLLGSHASVLPSTTVDDFAVIGASSMASGHVPANTTILGVPGRKFF